MTTPPSRLPWRLASKSARSVLSDVLRIYRLIGCSGTTAAKRRCASWRAPPRLKSMKAMEQWGMAMGPMAVGDLAGLDIGYRAREQLSDEEKDPASTTCSRSPVEAGRLGKNRAQYYRHDLKPAPDRRTLSADIIEATRAELGITARS